MTGTLKNRWTLSRRAGIQAVELGGGAYPGSRHLDDLGGVQKLIEDAGARKKLQEMLDSRHLELTAISVHGNALHPNKTIAKEHHDAFVGAVLLAEKMGIKTVNGFSGCPSGPGGPKSELGDVSLARRVPRHPQLPVERGRHSLLERAEPLSLPRTTSVSPSKAHPGFIVYNPETVLKLREAAGENIGCNFDPSHFWWQGIDPIAAVRHLGPQGAIFHVHAKDTRIDPINSGINGNLGREILRRYIRSFVGVPLGGLRAWAGVVERFRNEPADGGL